MFAQEHEHFRLFLFVKVYRERVYGVSMNCAHLAAKYGVKRYVEVSTAQVYNSDKVCMCVLCMYVLLNFVNSEQPM